MKNTIIIILLFIVIISCRKETNKPSIKQQEGELLFNGKNLDHWRGDSKIWSVENGCIVGETSEENKIDQNTFLIYDRPFADFELSFQYKIIGGNSGVQYRAKVLDEDLFIVGGYQADMEAGVNYSGILYEEKGRGILAKRGEKVIINEDGKKTVELFTTSEEIQSIINKEQWNKYRIVVKGDHLQHFINDYKTIDVTDKEIHKKATIGIIALQVHTGPEMKVYYKNIMIQEINK